MDEADGGPGVQECLRFYRRLAAGVTVVTSHDALGPVGMTASAVTSLSLRPPMMLVCVARGSTTLAAIRDRRTLAIHLLREDQPELAETFSRPGNARQRFDGVPYRLVFGAPVLPDVLAWSVCLVTGTHSYGDHDVVIGRLAITHTGMGSPLIWHNHRFLGLPPVVLSRA